MYCFSCFGEAHGDFFTRNNLFILNFTLKKKLIVTRSFFLRCFTLQVVQELKGTLFPWVGEVPGGIFGNHSFVCSCVVQQNVRVCLPVQHLQPFPWLLSDLHSSGRWSQSPGDAAGQMSPLVTSLGWEPKGKLGREQRGACGAAE